MARGAAFSKRLSRRCAARFDLLLQPAENEGYEEAYRGHDADHRAALLVGLGHHGTRQHGQDSARGESLDRGDHIPGAPDRKRYPKRAAAAEATTTEPQSPRI